MESYYDRVGIAKIKEEIKMTESDLISPSDGDKHFYGPNSAVVVMVEQCSAMQPQEQRSPDASTPTAVTTTRVLFIGNSLTFYNDLPDSVSN